MKQKMSLKEIGVIIGCCLLFGCVAGIGQNCRGVFYPEMTSDLGISMSKLTLYTTFYGVASALFMTMSCKLFQTMNSKIFLAAMSAIYGGTMMAMSFANHVYWFYGLGFLQGIGGGFICFFPMQHIIGNWFPDRKGSVLGFVLLSSGIAGVFVNPWAASLITAHGWRFTYRLMAGIILALTVPASLFLLDRTPESAGVEVKKSAGAAGGNSKSDFLAKDSTPAEVAIMFFYVLSIALFIGISQHLSKFALSIGKSATFGGMLVSASMAGNLAGKAILGPLNDKIGGRKSSVLASAVIACGSLLVLFSKADFVLVVTAFSIGIIMAITALQTPLIFRSSCSKEQFDRIYPLQCSINTLFASISQFFLSAIFDFFGSYTQVFASCGVVVLIGTVLLVVMDRSISRRTA